MRGSGSSFAFKVSDSWNTHTHVHTHVRVHTHTSQGLTFMHPATLIPNVLLQIFKLLVSQWEMDEEWNEGMLAYIFGTAQSFLWAHALTVPTRLTPLSCPALQSSCFQCWDQEGWEISPTLNQNEVNQTLNQGDIHFSHPKCWCDCSLMNILNPLFLLPTIQFL